jgi:hypothetical protein
MDNAHTPTSGRVREYRQRTEEFLKARALLVVILTDEEFFWDLNSLMSNKY